MKPKNWRQHADRAADSIAKACVDWGEVETLAFEFQELAIKLKTNRAAAIMQWISTNLHTIHDEAVK